MRESTLKAAVQIRWLIRRDFPEVLEIERASYGNPWSEEDFLNHMLRSKNGIGMIAENAGRIEAFIVYTLHRGRIAIQNLAVRPIVRRQGIGSVLVRRLIEKLSAQRRRVVEATVREGNVPAQLFLRENGFRCNRLLRGHYEDPDEDGLLFEWVLPMDDYLPDGEID